MLLTKCVGYYDEQQNVLDIMMRIIMVDENHPYH
jgi:hypothetical protein